MRKMVDCSDCNASKEHFGLGRCSACLRKYKRRTRPSFYLGTCYSEISRRIRTYDPLRPNYYNKDKCTKDEFFSKFLEDSTFLNLFKSWQLSGFRRGEAPSIDRIDRTLGYTLDNMRFIKQNINSCKEDKKMVYIETSQGRLVLESQKSLADFLGVSPAMVCKKLKSGKIKGYKIGRV